MSAIGSYVRLRAVDLDHCLLLAARASDARPFSWPWQPRVESGREAFSRQWTAAVREEVVFGESGHVLSSYFLVQEAINQLPDPFQGRESASLANVFTAAFVARRPTAPPGLDGALLQEFCRDEWKDDAPGMVEGILAAHAFVTAGFSKARPEEPIVFIVS